MSPLQGVQGIEADYSQRADTEDGSLTVQVLRD